MKALLYSLIGIFIVFSILFLIFSYNNIHFEKNDNYYLITAEKDILPNSAIDIQQSLAGYSDNNGAYVITNLRYAFTTHLDIYIRVKGYIDIPSAYPTIRDFYLNEANRSIILNTNYCEIISISLAPVGSYMADNLLYSYASFKNPSDVKLDISYYNWTFVDVVPSSLGNNTLVVPVNFEEIFKSMSAVYNSTLEFKPIIEERDTEIGNILEILDYYIIKYPSYIFMYVENFYNLLRG